MIEDLSKYIKNPNDKNQQMVDVLEDKKKETSWYAGGQLEALQYYLSSEVKILASCGVGDYQGEYFAILFVDGKLFLWRDSFGSCSGCDSLDGSDEKQGYDYIKATMTSVKEFENIEDIWKYLNKPDDYLYSNESVLTKLKKSYEENGNNTEEH